MAPKGRPAARPGDCEYIIGRCGRFLSLMMVCGAVVFSVMTMLSCNFFHMDSVTDEPWHGLNPALDDAIAVDMGLFQYKITKSNDTAFVEEIDSVCSSYGGRFQNLDFHMNDDLWTVAQACAVYAPVVAFLGIILALLEACCCSFFGSSIFPGLLYLGSFALQGTTFLVFVHSEYCFVGGSSLECRLDAGAWYSIGATSAYFFAAIFMCAIPRTPSFVETAWCCMGSREVVQPKRSATTATRTEEDSTAYQHSSNNTRRTRSHSLEDVELASGHHQPTNSHRQYHHQQQHSRQDAIREEDEDDIDDSDSAFHEDDDDDSDDSGDDY